jgi:magnesium-transporting ATPase (P-type)
MRIDNSIFTGSNDLVQCTIEPVTAGSIIESSHLAFFGATCREGTGRGVVLNTGASTAIG